MTKQAAQNDTLYREYYEYHGNTAIERIRKYPKNRIVRDWILFNSAEEAMAFFYNEVD
jgi:hypothetical protein